MAEQLGSAELEVGANLAPLDAKLVEAEARVARSVAVMQAMLDKLQADVDIRVSALDALATRAATAAVPAGQTGGGPSGHSNQIWGIRGPERPGSIENPIVQLIAAGKYYPMGSRAAAVGDDNQQDTQLGEGGSGLATSADIAELTSAMQDLARQQNPVSKLSRAGAVGIAEPESAQRTVVALDTESGGALKRMADSLVNIEEQATRPAPPGRPSTAILSDEERSGIHVGTGRFQDYNKPLTGLSRQELEQLAAGRGIEGAGDLATKADVAAAIAAVGDRSTPKAQEQKTIVIPASSGGTQDRVFVTGSGGQPTVVGASGSSTVRLDTAQYAGLISAILESGNGAAGLLATGGGSGGGGRGPVVLGSPGGGGGGGGGHFTPWFVPSVPTPGGSGGLLATLGLGKGIAGLAGIGTLGSFAGLGAEHALLVGLGILGSAGAAVGGAGALGLGAAGTIGVGAGSDLGVLKSTITDTTTLANDYTALSQAVAVYGKNSSQAKTATQQLNADMQALGDTAGVKAEAGLAQAAQAADHFFDMSTGQARVQAVNILMQAVQSAYTFIPLIAEAATRNLAMINESIKPLFAWLEGPQGVQIWNDLENKFASDLPAAMGAFDNGVELLLRVVDIASNYVGGFVGWLDKLFTRLNSESNMTLSAEIGKLVDDFRLWEHFAALLVEDLYGLFHADVGTGSSIIGMLNHMLEDVREYEKSTSGQAQLTNIFMVHKQEIDELLQVLPSLADTFSHVYMAFAPPVVAAMNDVVLPVLDDIGKALAFISKQSHAAAIGMGLFLVAGKAFGFGPTAKFLGGLLGIGGAEAATGAAAGAGTAATATAGATGGAAAALKARGLLGYLFQGGVGESAENLFTKVSGALPGGFGSAEAAGVAAEIGPIVAAVVPAVLATGAGIAGVRFLANALGVHTGPSKTVELGGAGPLKVTSSSPGMESSLPGILGKAENIPLGIGTDLLGTGGKQLTIVGSIAHASTDQLKELQKALEGVNKVTLNGTNEPIKQLKALVAGSLDLRDKWSDNFLVAWKAVNTFYRNTGMSLSDLKDDFQSNTLLIAHEIGLNTANGEKLMAANVQKMVAALQLGMASGTMSVKDGMAEIKNVLGQGMTDNAITWKTKWSDMFSTMTTLMEQGKIGTKTWTGDILSMMGNAFTNIKQNTIQSYQSMFASLKSQMQDGIITKKNYVTQVQELTQKMVSSEKTSMTSWAANTFDAMVATGKVSLSGAQAIAKELNELLKPLGAKLIPVPSLSPVSGLSAPGVGLHGGTNAATGALYQIGQMGEAGRDSVPMNVGGQDIMVAPGEQVAVFNRHQLPIVNAALARMGGLPGLFANVRTPNYMAGGGMVGGGSSLERMLAEANAINSQNYPYVWGGGHNAGFIGPYDCSGAVSAVLHAGGDLSAPMVADQFMTWGLPGPGAVTVYADPVHTFMSIDGRFFGTHGASGASWYNGSAVPGFVQRHPANIGAGGIGSINVPKVAGTGALADIVRAGLMDVGKAASGKLMSAANATMAGGQFSGGDFGTFPAGLGGNISNIVQALSKQHGWAGQAGDWMNVLGAEDGSGSLTARNPSGAYGLAQFINGPSEYAQYGGNANTAQGQLVAMGNYIKQRYGDPTAAWAHEQTFHNYAGGGMAWGDGGMVPGYASGGIAGGMGEINSLLNNQIPYLSGEYNYEQGITSTNGPSPSQLSQMIGWENQILTDYKMALGLAEGLVQPIKETIGNKRQQINNLAGQVRQNLGRIKQLQGQTGGTKADKAKRARDIANLMAQNRRLAGAAGSSGAPSSATGGSIGILNRDITGLQTDLTTVQSYLPGGSAELQGLFPQDPSAPIGQTEQTIFQLSGTTATSTSQSDLVSLLQQQLATSQETNFVLSQQYNVLSNLPPFGGIFHSGGVVPGPPGAARMILAQGGEVVTPMGGGGGDTHVHISGNNKWLEKLIDVRVEQKTRKMSRDAMRGMPGKPGLLVNH